MSVATQKSWKKSLDSSVRVVILQMGIRFMILHQETNAPYVSPPHTHMHTKTPALTHTATTLYSAFISSHVSSGDAFITNLLMFFSLLLRDSHKCSDICRVIKSSVSFSYHTMNQQTILFLSPASLQLFKLVTKCVSVVFFCLSDFISHLLPVFLRVALLDPFDSMSDVSAILRSI